MGSIGEKIFGREKVELEALIKEALDKTSNEDIQEVQKEAIKDEFNDVNKMIINYYNEKQGNTDIQKELAQSFAVGGLEKLREREQEQALKDADLPEGIDEETKKRAMEKVKEEGKDKKLTKEELQSEIYKAIYEQVFEEYSNLMYSYKKQQIENRSLTVGDKEGTKLIIYERYLTKIENINHKIGGESFSQDERISKLREKFKKEFEENQKQVDENTGEDIEELRRLYERKKEIAQEIEYLTVNPQLATDNQLESLRKEYIAISFEIRSKDPSLKEYSDQIAEREKNEAFAEREGITTSSTDNLGDNPEMAEDSISKNTNENSPPVNKEERGDLTDNVEEVKKLEEEEKTLKESRKKDIIARINKAKEQGDIDEVNRLLSEYRLELEGDELIADVGDETISQAENKGEEEYMDYIAGLNAINSTDEMIEQVISGEAYELTGTDEKTTEISNEGPVRTLYNKK